MLKISELYIYPIKSLPGVTVTKAQVTKTGFEHDRRWMLVGENNRFISQREAPQMTQLLVAIDEDGLKITHKINGESLILPFNTPPLGGRGASRVVVTIWDDTCVAEFVGNDADDWFSQMLGFKCRLVYMPDDTKRIVDQKYAPGDSITSFSDAYPFLIIGQASLDDLNNRLAVPLPMDRFRPNIVYTGGHPYEEDLMGRFTIGGISFRGVKLCARCPITTINQQDASRGKEPLKTLASYRQKNNKVLFGQNIVHTGEGIVKVGDDLHVLSYNEDEIFMVNITAKKIDKYLV
ncbi:MOSC N-terminal beta barrel domain-containing protein [Mucilaginibacter sp.]|uniref:MOSC domain-containing protein n=1 Tax=Mucilaginibacter sp. TaxID=1882438 RepID=UPI0028510AA4|nr:MOSC N-terminal beta barrel domain-containing protein [Mucilaginibacter sp.]MDR3695055.1 MOSC domain-containing protein [Mucilaginibacter sp.]